METYIVPNSSLRLPQLAVLDYLVYPVFLAAFFATLFFFDLAQRIAFAFGEKQLEKTVLLLNRSLVACLKLVSARITVKGFTKFPSDRPYIIVANHQSLFDISIIHNTFAHLHPKFVAKKELSKWIPAVSFCLRNEGSAIIDRDNGKQSIQAIIKLGRRIKQNNRAAVIFPEGTRARDSKLKEFKAAGLIALSRAVPDALIIPVAIDGSWKLAARRLGPIPRNTNVVLSVGEPYERKQVSETDICNEAYRQIENMLKEN